MTLTELRYVLAVFKERHFGRAATMCKVSQPTLSIAIKKLEDELGVAIFDRSSSEVTVTMVGEQIICQAQKILGASDKIYQLARQNQDDLCGPFRLGLIFTVAPYVLPKLVVALHELAPQLSLQLSEGFTSHLLEKLKRGELDAMVVAEPFQEMGVETYPLYDEPFFVIVPKGHHFENKDQIDEKELVQEKILMLTEGNCMRDNILDGCQELAARQNIIGLTNTLQGSSIDTIRHMVASGLAISILPATSLTENDHLFFSIIPFNPPVPSRRVILAARRQFIRPEALEIIRQAIFHSRLNGVCFIDKSK